MDATMISAGIQAVGGLFSGITGLFAGNAKAKAYEHAADQAKFEAGVNTQTALQQGDAVVAQGAVRAAANGGGLVGSSVAKLQDLSDQAMFNARTQIYRGMTEAAGDEYQEHLAKAQAASSMISATIGAAGSLASGWAKDAQMKKQDQYLAALHGEGGSSFGSDTSLDGLY